MIIMHGYGTISYGFRCVRPKLKGRDVRFQKEIDDFMARASGNHSFFSSRYTGIRR